tara:strand:- start:192 stop:437 length:246 start_codon:yes stop_codon:yes gene_type:complete
MLDEDLKKIQNELWDVVNHHVGPEDKEAVFALSGSMMAIAIELYTTLLLDEEIEGILEVIAEDIPKMRKNMTKKLGKRILH